MLYFELEWLMKERLVAGEERFERKQQAM